MENAETKRGKNGVQSIVVRCGEYTANAALQNARLNEAAEIRKLRTYYDEFRGWAEEFDAAPLEIKRMILSQLIERVEVGRKYQVTIKLNMEYQQFLEITEEQKLIPLISA